MAVYWTVAPLYCNYCHPTYEGNVYDPPSLHDVDEVFHDHYLYDCSQKVEKVVDEDHCGDVVGNLAHLQHVLQFACNQRMCPYWNNYTECSVHALCHD